jgi:hypothetical protein
MKYNLIVLAAILGTIALAQAVTSYKLNINNKAFSSPAIVVKGETYVPLKVLQAAGVRSSLSGGTLSLTLPNVTNTEGGANQVAALEGCLNEWIFNGIWRVRATNPTPITGDRNGLSVRFEFRNGTQANGIAPSGTGWGGVQVALDDGTTVSAANTNDVRDPGYVPGGSHMQTLEFFWDDVTRTPKKLIVVFNPKEMNTSANVKFSVPDPSLRVKLDCTK